jgi:creatinine amidohydrolase
MIFKMQIKGKMIVMPHLFEFFFGLFILCIPLISFTQERNKSNKAIFLEDISWTSAIQYLTEDAVVLIPLGAGAKEHGPHLPLSTDFIQAEGFAKEIALLRKVIITPVVNYGFYPAFLQYPGSTSTNFKTATDLIVQIIRSIAGYGPRRFYIINIGVSTTPTLETAAKILADEGLLLYYSRYDRAGFDKAEAVLRTKEYGGHADELETSNVLWLRPDLVDMKKAVNDSSMKGQKGGMSPKPVEGGNINVTGINGYAALGTSEKGKKLIPAFTKELVRELDSITLCPLPAARNRAAEYAAFEGVYTDIKEKKLVISQRRNELVFNWDGRDDRNHFFHLYKDGPDYFSSMYLNILFTRNDAGEVEKAWCQYRGEYFWVKREKVQ